VGSWCQYYYRILFDNTHDIPLIRTTDIDLLIPNSPKIKRNVDIGQSLNSLGIAIDLWSGKVMLLAHPS
jgi:hypothetical protein